MSYPINDLSGSFRNNDAVLGEEIVSLRTRHGKVFALGANRFQAVTYSCFFLEFIEGFLSCLALNVKHFMN